ncbi:MAG: hypothetical protein CVU55_15830 [Deltaproteobacteria bacterium HGW-Deltaproteobacteria-13]|jgi:hypothetical protein|nr:MAG: hypothetical protein CVU55_15830 [Deltaproteobacteria bacterium HGW-Deltaproteobacteria-13]
MVKYNFFLKKSSAQAYFMRYFILAVLLACPLMASVSAHADSTMAPENQFHDAAVNKRSVLKIGYENTKLPDNQSMGIIGTTYLIEIGHGFYFGPAAYGAVTGDKGGFFTAGGELAWHYPLISQLELQTGIYAGGGGGGGGRSLWGGGLMLRPHLDLIWNFGIFQAGMTASNVSFPNGGDINSTQIGFVLAREGDFSYVTSDLAGRRLASRGRQGFGVDRAMVTVGSYFPGTGVQKLGGGPSEDHMGYVGARLEQFITPSLYWGFEAAGAASGDSDGYAEFLGTLGVETSIWKDYLTVGSRLALGMGGGGGVSVGGGLLGKLGAYTTFNLSRSTHLSLEGGYAVAPDGDFRAPYGSVNLGFDLDHPFDNDPQGTVDEYEFIFGSEHYFDAVTKDGDKRDIDAVVIKFNRYLGDSIYLTGQAHSAYNGESGSYSVGLVGIGYRSPKFVSVLSAGAEMLAGAAGGASLDTDGGMVVQPMAYLGVQLTKEIGIKLGAGRIISVKGKLDSTVLDMAVSFNFGVSRR